MLNFPVAAGTSGHLLGGALAAILVGPWAGALCVAVVLLVQALFFADGGLTALGLNITTWPWSPPGRLGGLPAAALRLLPKAPASVVPASCVAACVSVRAASLRLHARVRARRHHRRPARHGAAAMVGVHVLIGIGEAVITALTVGACSRSGPTWCTAPATSAAAPRVPDGRPAASEVD